MASLAKNFGLDASSLAIESWISSITFNLTLKGKVVTNVVKIDIGHEEVRQGNGWSSYGGTLFIREGKKVEIFYEDFSL